MTHLLLWLPLSHNSFNACINRHWITSQNYWRCVVERGRARKERRA